MKKLLLFLVGIVTAVAIISCGGGGVTSLSPAGRAVQKMQRFSFLSMANSGLGFLGFGGFGGGGGTTGSTTGGSTGGGGGIVSIGGFVRNFGGPNGIGSRTGRHHALGTATTGGTTTTGGTGGSTDGGTDGGTTGGGGGTGDDFYFDEWLQLWVDTHWTETTFTSNFYLDQAKTQPAGHIISTFAGNWEVFPQSYTSDYAFTAGSMAGSSGTYECTQTSESVGSMTYHNTYVDGSHDHGEANWSEAGSTWNSRWDGADATWYEDSGIWEIDGSGTYSCSNSAGWSSVWHYNADWSGSAHFEGPEPFLPADLTWTSDGHYRIVYADGKVEEWSWEDLWGDGGTTGEGTGSTTSGGQSSGSTGDNMSGSTGGGPFKPAGAHS